MFVLLDMISKRGSSFVCGYISSPSILFVIHTRIFERRTMKDSRERWLWKISFLYVIVEKVFSQKDSGPWSNTRKHSAAQLPTHSRPGTKEHFFHSAADMTYVASFLLCSFYFALSVGLVLGNSERHSVMERKESWQISLKQGNWNIIWLCSQFKWLYCLTINRKTLCSCGVTSCVALMWFWHQQMTLP